MFGDYMNPDAEPDERVYDEILNLDDMYAIVEQCLEEYNNTHKNRMNLVIFRWVEQEEWLLTLVLLNLDILCLYKQCRSRSVGFFRS